MSTNWRISSFSGALLAAYFIPAWTNIAFQIMISPIHGLYERPNISMALFVSDHLHLTGMATVRFAWLLALGRMTVVAFFAIFLVFITRASIRKSGGCDEALGMALGIGSVHQFRQHADGVAGRRDRGAAAACDRALDDARHRHRAAGRAARAETGRASACRRPIYPFSSPNSATIADASLTAWLAAGTPQ